MAQAHAGGIRIECGTFGGACFCTRGGAWPRIVASMEAHTIKGAASRRPARGGID